MKGQPAGFIALALVVGVLSGCRGSQPASESAQRSPIAVTITTVATTGVAERLEAGGVLAARESALVSSRIVAPIVTVPVTAGDRIRTGDVLVTLDAPDVSQHARQADATALAAEKALAHGRAEQAAAEAEQRLATAWHTRISALHARHSATDQERDEAEARLATATARAAGTAAAIDMAEANLTSARAAASAAVTTESFSILRAPFDGLVTERLTDPGNLAAPGTPLLRIESNGPQHVTVRVDEARAGYVHPGDRAEVWIDAPGDAPTRIEGVVSEVARAIAADERAFTVKIALPSGVRARTGTFARVVFRGAVRQSLVVPSGAIRRFGQVTSVFVVQQGVARLRMIQAGRLTDQGIEVLAGLDAGESIVAAPTQGLADGSPVTVGSGASAAGGPQ